jgi:short-subunit dehydrogenase
LDYGVESLPCAIDLAQEEFIEKVKGAVGERRIGLLICCASFGFVGPFETCDVKRYTDLIHVAVYHYFRLTYEYYPKMLRDNRGGIILTSSVNVAAPLGLSAVYTASKAFELYLASALRWESRRTKLDIMVLLPGPTKTNFQKKAGTRVAPWAMDPDAVAARAFHRLGRKGILVTGWRNRLFHLVISRLPFASRIDLGSRVYSGVLEPPKRG